MCANYLLEIQKAKLAAFYGLSDDEFIEFGKSDIFPGYLGTVFLKDEDGSPRLSAFQWGLLPPWAKTPKDKPQPFNARGETVATSAMFKTPFSRRRCLIPATGFYEWKADDAGRKHRYRFHVPHQEVFSIAGIWNSWNDEVFSYTMITIEPNTFMTDYHDRMPVILSPQDYERWLSPKTSIKDAVQLLVPYAGDMKSELSERETGAKKE